MARVRAYVGLFFSGLGSSFGKDFSSSLPLTYVLREKRWYAAWSLVSGRTQTLAVTDPVMSLSSLGCQMVQRKEKKVWRADIDKKRSQYALVFQLGRSEMTKRANRAVNELALTTRYRLALWLSGVRSNWYHVLDRKSVV